MVLRWPRIGAVLVALTSFTVSAPVPAAESMVLEHLEVTLEEWGPYLHPGKPGLTVMTDRLSLLLQRAGIVPHFRYQPFARTQRDLQLPNGEVLLAFPMAQRPEREAWLLLSEPLFDVDVVLLWHQAQPLSLSALAAVGSTHRVAALRESSTARWCEAHVRACVGGESGLQILRQLAARRVDAALLSAEAARALLKEHAAGLYAIRQGETPVFRFTVHLALPRHHPGSVARLTRINQALSALGAEGKWSRDLARLRPALSSNAD